VIHLRLGRDDLVDQLALTMLLAGLGIRIRHREALPQRPPRWAAMTSIPALGGPSSRIRCEPRTVFGQIRYLDGRSRRRPRVASSATVSLLFFATSVSAGRRVRSVHMCTPGPRGGGPRWRVTRPAKRLLRSSRTRLGLWAGGRLCRPRTVPAREPSSDTRSPAGLDRQPAPAAA
jgi:hypothetical protein